MPKTSLPSSLRNKVKSSSDLKTNKSLLASQSTPLLGSIHQLSKINDTTNINLDPEVNCDVEIEIIPTRNDEDLFNYSSFDQTIIEGVETIKRNFVDTLNLTTKQNYDLYNLPNTFYYLRIRNSGENQTNDLKTVNSSLNIESSIKKNTTTMNTTASTNNLRISRTITKQEPTETVNKMTGTLMSQTFSSFYPKKDTSTLSGSVYDLEVVSQKEIDKNYYFTISSQGVTLFHNKESHFTPMTQWNREFELFQRVSNIKFFKLYKRWKVIFVCLLSVFLKDILIIYILMYIYECYRVFPSGSVIFDLVK